MSVRARLLVRIVAAALFVLLANLPPPAGQDLSSWLPIRHSLAIFVLCLVLWVTSALPLMVTSLLPLVLFPLLGVLPEKQSFGLFGNEVVFFLLGVFILSSAIMRSGLSARIAWRMLGACRGDARLLLALTLLIPALGSFLMSEHAVAAMFFPIVLEVGNVLNVHSRHQAFGRALFLALAYGCIIGGVATYLGGGRAPLAVGILHETTGDSVSFLRWMVANLPLVVVMLGFAFGALWWMTRDDLPDMRPVQELLEARSGTLGAMTGREKQIAALMAATIVAWAGFASWLGGLAGIALLSVVAAFAFGLLDWSEVEQDVNWGVLLMYGGAIVLGFAMQASGAAAWLSGAFLTRWHLPPWAFVALISFLSLSLTACMSNSAVVAMLLPVVLNYAADDLSMARLVTASIAVPAGLDFILPMGTPALALAFASGLLTVRQTVGYGTGLAVTAWVVFNLSAHLWLPVVGMAP
ncbi:DASS family sodium-coupled anion symporter [Candidatus Poribacteria bacterium]|nr:DASS family sodium-coupled anion symporter [Candidatus Poribacteria bacterium]